MNNNLQGSSLARLLFIFVCGAFAFSAVACGSKTPAQLLADADNALAQGNVVQAVSLYKEFLEKHPDDPGVPKAKMGLVQGYFDNKEFDRCRELLDEILVAAGGPATDAGFEPFRTKVASYAFEGDAAGGLAYAESTAGAFESAGPQLRSAYQFILADLYTQLQRIGEAKAIYNEVLAGPGDTPDQKLLHSTALSLMLKFAAAQNDNEGGIALMENYIAGHPDSPEVPELQVRVARAYDYLSSQSASPKREQLAAKANGYFQSAEKHFRIVLETTLIPDEKAESLLRLGQLLHFQRKNDEGRDLYRQAIDDFKLSPVRPQAMSLLAASYYLDGDYETSAAVYSDVIEAYPNTPVAQEAGRGIEIIAQTRAQMAAQETIEGGVEGEGSAEEAAPAEGESPAEAEAAEEAAEEAVVEATEEATEADAEEAVVDATEEAIEADAEGTAAEAIESEAAAQ